MLQTDCWHHPCRLKDLAGPLQPGGKWGNTIDFALCTARARMRYSFRGLQTVQCDALKDVKERILEHMAVSFLKGNSWIHSLFEEQTRCPM